MTGGPKCSFAEYEVPNFAGESDDSNFEPIDVPHDARSIDAIVQFLVGELVRTQQLRQDLANEIGDAVLRRESLGSTSKGRGVAVPHAQSDAVAKAIAILGRCDPPVHWKSSLEHQLVHIVCLVVTPTSSSISEALEIAAQLLRRK